LPGITPASERSALKRIVERDIEKWARLIQDAGITAE